MYGDHDDNDYQHVYDSDLHVHHADIFCIWIRDIFHKSDRGRIVLILKRKAMSHESKGRESFEFGHIDAGTRT